MHTSQGSLFNSILLAPCLQPRHALHRLHDLPRQYTNMRDTICKGANFGRRSSGASRGVWRPGARDREGAHKRTCTEHREERGGEANAWRHACALCPCHHVGSLGPLFFSSSSHKSQSGCELAMPSLTRPARCRRCRRRLRGSHCGGRGAGRAGSSGLIRGLLGLEFLAAVQEVLFKGVSHMECVRGQFQEVTLKA